MSSKIERAREAVIEFFKTANPQDEFFMITFSDRPEVISDFTQSVEDIQSKLIYTVPKGRTALLDAIYLGVSEIDKQSTRAKHCSSFPMGVITTAAIPKARSSRL